MYTFSLYSFMSFFPRINQYMKHSSVNFLNQTQLWKFRTEKKFQDPNPGYKLIGTLRPCTLTEEPTEAQGGSDLSKVIR